MQRNTLFSFLTVAALGLLTAGPSYAGTFTWKATPEDNVFQNENNWTASGFHAELYPSAGDTVTIQATTNDKDPEISHNEIFATLTIDNSGELTVTGANTLTLTGSSHTLNGNLVLQDDDSIVKFTGETVTASGTSTTGIKGEDDGAKIQIKGGNTLTSTMLIQGQMIIKTDGGTGDGIFRNGGTGIVLANANGILLLDGTLKLDDSTGAEWSATGGANNELRFDTGLAFVDTSGDELVGKVVLCGDATIRFKVEVDTAGCFDESNANGWLRFENGGSFSHDDDTCAGGDPASYSSDTEFTGSCT